MKNPLTTTSILLHLELCSWAGEVKDQKVLQIIAAQYKSDTHHDKYVKSLFINDPLSTVELCKGRLRNHFYARTVPWLDGGKGRLIPSMDFESYAEKHSDLKHDFFHEVGEFLKSYPDHKELAKQRKGDLYNEAEYPTVDELRNRFSVTLHALPFPNTEDFRIDAPEHVIQTLEHDMNAAVTQVQKVISDDLATRLNKRIGMLLKTLKVGKRFSGSLLTELQDVVNIGARLRESINPALLQRLDATQAHILKYTPELIRNSVSVQDALIEKCEELL